MENNAIIGLKNKIAQLEHELLNLAKKISLTDAESRHMQMIKQELLRAENDLMEQKEMQQNWSCSYSYRSDNGKVSKKFFINNHEVNENEYRRFVDKVSDTSRKGNSLYNMLSNGFDSMLKDLLFDDFPLTNLLED